WGAKGRGAERALYSRPSAAPPWLQRRTQPGLSCAGRTLHGTAVTPQFFSTSPDSPRRKSATKVSVCRHPADMKTRPGKILELGKGIPKKGRCLGRTAIAQAVPTTIECGSQGLLEVDNIVKENVFYSCLTKRHATPRS